MSNPTLADIVNGHIDALLPGYIERHREDILDRLLLWAEERVDRIANKEVTQCLAIAAIMETGEWVLTELAKSHSSASSLPDGESTAARLETPENSCRWEGGAFVEEKGI